jgi:MoaA/NifB/PqqE/SkfB family radical SAM enzyme
MLLKRIEEFDASRRLGDKALRSACYAPYTNLYFTQWGEVQACCWGRNYAVGDIRTDSVKEIWHGLRLQRLRASLKNYNFELGCELCEEQLARGWARSANMHNFDRYSVSLEEPLWPARIELSISNSCNLMCVMCNGEFSTAIRKHREGKPRRLPIYPATFTQQLREFIPHLQVLKFLGGEPFLIKEYYEIWEAMIADGCNTTCHVTTNATVFTAKVAHVLENLRMAFAVSLDGVTKKTVEAIRVGARFDEQLKNLRVLRQYTREKGTHLALVYCFMRQNWHELGEFCLFADTWDCDVGINTVNYPPEFGVYNLPTPELKSILSGMEMEVARLETCLKRNRQVWFNELERVRRCLESRVS